MKRRQWLALGLLTGAVFSFGPTSARAQTLDRCQKQIENLGRGFQDQVFKALQKCKDFYRLEVVRSQANPAYNLTAALDRRAKACGIALDKVLGTPNGLGGPIQKTQAEKYYKKLDDLLVRGICTNLHLVQLGYLPETLSAPCSGYGDWWKRWFLTAMLKSAYERQLWLVSDLPAILASLADPDSASLDPTLKCAVGTGPNWCAVLSVPPCHKLNCRIDPVVTQLTIGLCGLGSTTAALSGEVVQEYCQFPPYTGCDLAIVGNPARTIDPVSFLGNTACTANLRSMGFVKGPTSCTIQYEYEDVAGTTLTTTISTGSVVSGPRNVEVCQSTSAPPPVGTQDNCVNPPAPDLGPSGGCLQLPAATNTSDCGTVCSGMGSGPGPIHVNLTGSVSTGDSVALSHLQIVTKSGTECPGGHNAPRNQVPLFFTTGSTKIDVDGDPTCSTCGVLNIGPVSGTPLSDLDLDNVTDGSPGDEYLTSQDLSGLVTSGGFPGACPDALPPLFTGFTIACGP